MNTQLQIGFIIVVLLGLIMLSTTYSCSNFKAFSKESMFAKFEGFEANSSDSANSPSELAAPKEESDDEKEDEAESEKEVEAFRGLQPTEISNTNAVLDNIGGNTNGSAQCMNRSSGLSNDKGPLCLSDAQIQLLKTRGGNSSGNSEMNVKAYSGK